MESNNILSIILSVIISYILIGGIFAPFAILFLGYIDWVILISTGAINTFLLFKFLKMSILKSTITGFLISSSSLIFMYILYLLTSYNNIGISLLLFLISSILIILLIKYKNWKFSSLVKSFFLTISSFLCFFLALKLKNYYPNESRNVKSFSFKVIDSHNKPIIGDSVEVSILRQPMLNLQELYEIEKLITDNKGEFKTSLSQSTKYRIRDYNYDDWMRGSFEIDYTDLKNRNEIILEIKE